MSVKICPNCGNELEARKDSVGKYYYCYTCSESFEPRDVFPKDQQTRMDMDYLYGNPAYAFPLKTYSSCNHWRQPVNVGRYTVTCSSYPANRDLRDSPPDFGFYFYTGWADKLGLIVTNGSYIKSIARVRPYPALFTDWKDFSDIKQALLEQLITIALSKIRHGKKIDVGCMAGHGRTGSFVACIISAIEHLDGETAIDELHRRYCSHAVESASQKEMIIKFAERYERSRLNGRNMELPLR